MTDKRKDVIVIGGGLSGLSAAKLLTEEGLDVVLLEARDRVGGRTYTIQNEKCKWVDLGGAYVGPTQNRLLRLARELGVKTYLVNEKEHLVMQYEGKSQMFKNSFPSFYNPFIMMDLNNFFRTLDSYGTEIPVDAPWDAPRAKEWDSISVKDWFDQIFWTKTARRLAEISLEVCVTSEPSEVSMLWYMWYVRACQGSIRIMSTTNGGQERKFDGGSQQISNKLAEKLVVGRRVLLSKPVQGIKQTDSGATVITADGSKYEGSFVILATAPNMQMRIIHEPPLPPARNQLIQRAPMGSVIKCHLYYQRVYWKEKGKCGSLLTMDKGLGHPTIFTLDDTKKDGIFPCIVGFVAANKARYWMKSTTQKQRADALAKSLAKGFQEENMTNYIHYEEKNWMEEQWSGGCYTACLGPNVLTQFGKALREPTGCIHYAGTETASHWSGYMEGAVQAGERAAREILYKMGRITEDEIWQEEPQDKECFPRPLPTSFLERILPSVPGFLKMLTFATVTSTAVAAAYAAKLIKF